MLRLLFGMVAVVVAQGSAVAAGLPDGKGRDVVDAVCRSAPTAGTSPYRLGTSGTPASRFARISVTTFSMLAARSGDEGWVDRNDCER